MISEFARKLQQNCFQMLWEPIFESEQDLTISWIFVHARMKTLIRNVLISCFYPHSILWAILLNWKCQMRFSIKDTQAKSRRNSISTWVSLNSNDKFGGQKRLNFCFKNACKEYATDKARFCYDGLSKKRITEPMIRDPSGNLVPYGWDEVLQSKFKN